MYSSSRAFRETSIPQLPWKPKDDNNRTNWSIEAVLANPTESVIVDSRREKRRLSALLFYHPCLAYSLTHPHSILLYLRLQLRLPRLVRLLLLLLLVLLLLLCLLHFYCCAYSGLAQPRISMWAQLGSEQQQGLLLCDSPPFRLLHIVLL